MIIIADIRFRKSVPFRSPEPRQNPFISKPFLIIGMIA
jgi:hypothetical protein